VTSAGAAVTVIVPTHDHASTLDLAVASALSQTVTDLEVVIIGDGVGDDTRAVVADLVAGDSRVRFLDHPKSPSRAEPIRHEVLMETSAPVVCYLGDDDLLLSDHVAAMLGWLDDADFAHPLPFAVNRDGSLCAHPTDIARAECRAWHRHPGRNCISLTGAAHRVDAYRRLPHGWRTTPPGRWPDHYMWEQWFAAREVRFVTGDRLTMLKFDAWMREDLDAAGRRRELLEWMHRAQGGDFAAELRQLEFESIRGFAVQTRLDLTAREDAAAVTAAAQHARIEELEVELVRVHRHVHDAAEAAAAQRAVLEARCAAVAAELELMRATRTWRLRDRVLDLPGAQFVFARIRGRCT
jgi:GalNAc5-diNAcBac-PP-undecaprenol beta-1,3-glucosyltransferase